MSSQGFLPDERINELHPAFAQLDYAYHNDRAVISGYEYKRINNGDEGVVYVRWRQLPAGMAGYGHTSFSSDGEFTPRMGGASLLNQMMQDAPKPPADDAQDAELGADDGEALDAENGLLGAENAILGAESADALNTDEDNAVLLTTPGAIAEMQAELTVESRELVEDMEDMKARVLAHMDAERKAGLEALGADKAAALSDLATELRKVVNKPAGKSGAKTASPSKKK